MERELTIEEQVRAARIGVTHDLEAARAAEARLQERVTRVLRLLDQVYHERNLARTEFCKAHRKACLEKGRKGIAQVREINHHGIGDGYDGALLQFLSMDRPWASVDCVDHGEQLIQKIEMLIKEKLTAERKLSELQTITGGWKGWNAT